MEREKWSEVGRERGKIGEILNAIDTKIEIEREIDGDEKIKRYTKEEREAERKGEICQDRERCRGKKKRETYI